MTEFFLRSRLTILFCRGPNIKLSSSILTSKEKASKLVSRLSNGRESSWHTELERLFFLLSTLHQYLRGLMKTRSVSMENFRPCKHLCHWNQFQYGYLLFRNIRGLMI